MKKGILQSFLEALGDHALKLNTAPDTLKPRAPRLYTLTLLASILAAATDTNPATPLYAAASSLATLAALKGKHELPATIKPLLPLWLLTLATTIPLIAAGKTLEAASLTLHTTTATTMAAASIRTVGWKTLTQTLPPPLKPLAKTLTLIPVSIAALSREATTLLAAREARKLAETSITETWELEATALAALIERTIKHAETLAAAIEARSLGEGENEDSQKPSLAPHTPPATTIALWVILHAQH